jgi:hypothetical protein
MGKRKPTDKELLDWLQSQNDRSRHTGRCLFRLSTTGRGWRLQETELPYAQADVRLAIREAMALERAREAS